MVSKRVSLPTKISLAAKFSLLMTTLIVAAVMMVTLISIAREQANFRKELEQQAVLLLDVIRVNTADALYLLNVNRLSDVTSNLTQMEQGIGGRIYDADGRLLADSALGSTAAFNISPEMLGQTLVNRDEILFNWQDTQLEAGIPVIVGRDKVGAISVTLPTSILAAKMNQVRDQGVIFGVIAVIVGGFLAIAFSHIISEPLRQLTAASQQVAQGDFDQKVNIRTGDELSDLALAFNTMTERLRELVQKLKQRATDLQTANDHVLAASRVKSEFLATMSHELRTPLNAIIGFSDMLLMGISGPLNDKQIHKVERLQENGRRLLALVNDILDIARIEAGRIELRNDPFSPEILAQRLSAQMSVLAEKKNLALDTQVDGTLPPLLLGDEKIIEQVVVNLLSNAIKFTESGAVKLIFATEANMWSIVVNDTGVGIPPHALELIFEEFRQLDGSSTRAYQGSGLGLAISRHLVQIMNGKIGVQSTLGEGSIFTVHLPIRTPEQQALPVEKV